MDFTTKEIFKRYANLVTGKTMSPVFLNILVTSVCDMRCTHCFFTEELDDRPRKKLQMKADEIAKISETLGGNLSVLVLAGGEPFTRKVSWAVAAWGKPRSGSIFTAWIRSGNLMASWMKKTGILLLTRSQLPSLV